VRLSRGLGGRGNERGSDGLKGHVCDDMSSVCVHIYRYTPYIQIHTYIMHI
jgi:hypothetical protein